MADKMNAVCLWSGGKDSCFACYKAKQKTWIDRVCNELNITACMPLWKKDTSFEK